MRYFVLIFVFAIPLFSVGQERMSDTTFYSIYKNIFVTKCAIPACHDGSFEPDLRTLSSAYETLVYHPVIKNNAAKSFKYRVVPGDTAASVLYQRITNCCFVNNNDRMPFTLGLTLSDDQIRSISNWIGNGAKDMFGSVQPFINLPPDISDQYTAYYNDTILVTDLNRDSKLMYRPFNVNPDCKEIKIVFSLLDDISQAEDIKNVWLKLTTDSPDSVQVQVTHTHNNYWEVNFKTSGLVKNKAYYMQLCANDPVSGALATFPNKNTVGYLKNHWSFIIK